MYSPHKRTETVPHCSEVREYVKTRIDNSPTEAFILQSYSCYSPLILMLLSGGESLTPISAHAACGDRIFFESLFFSRPGSCAEFPTSELKKKGGWSLDIVA